MERNAIDEVALEHESLRRHMSNLLSICDALGTRSNCTGCPRDRVCRCIDATNTATEELFTFMVNHFGREERLMKDAGLVYRFHDECELHMQDHGDMSEAMLKVLVKIPDADPVVHLRHLSSCLSSWLDQHICSHDNTLLHQLQNA